MVTQAASQGWAPLLPGSGYDFLSLVLLPAQPIVPGYGRSRAALVSRNGILPFSMCEIRTNCR